MSACVNDSIRPVTPGHDSGRHTDPHHDTDKRTDEMITSTSELFDPAAVLSTGDHWPVASKEHVMEQELLQLVVRCLHVHGLPAICLLGVIGNVVGVILISAQRMRRLPLSHYVIGVLVVDSLYLATLLHTWLVNIRASTEGLYRFPVSCNALAFVEGSAKFLSVWLTVAFCTHHTTATLSPTRCAEGATSVVRAQVSIICLATLTVVININTSLTYGFVNVGNSRLLCTSLPRFNDVTRRLDDADVIVNDVIPQIICVICLLVFGLVNFSKLRQKLQRRRHGSRIFGTQSEYDMSESECDQHQRRHGGASVSRVTSMTPSNIAEDNNFTQFALANNTKFFVTFVLAFVALNLPLCLTKTIHKLTLVGEHDEAGDDLGYFLREEIARFLYYAKMAINLLLLMADGAFRRSSRMSVIVIIRTFGRFQRIRVQEEDTWEGDDDDDETVVDTPASATVAAAAATAATTVLYLQQGREGKKVVAASLYRNIHHDLHYHSQQQQQPNNAYCGRQNSACAERVVLVEDAV